MTIRLWLLVADCWRCGCSVELTAAQERQIRSLLQPTNESASTGPESPRNDLVADSAPVAARSQRHVPVVPVTAAQPAWNKLGNRPGKLKPATTTSTPAGQAATNLAVPQRKRLGDWLRHMPAWLISLLFHMALLALLALLFFENQRSAEDFYITLSTESNRMHRVGGEPRFTDPQDSVQFDMPIPKSKSPAVREALVKAQQDAKQLRVAPDARLPELPSLSQVKQQLRTGTAQQRTFTTRDPRVRGEIVTREGGTTLTEAAVARGLRWMSHHQSPDGSWSLDRFHRTESCRGRCRDSGRIGCDSAGTSLCLLPFLGAGQTHRTGIYRDTVAGGIRWLIDHQASNGDLRDGVESNAGMYAHGQGAIVLCEAYALTRDEQIGQAAQLAIDFIVSAQHSDGGWRYKPGQRGDTSVLGWQLMALQSARVAELEVPIETWELANVYLDSVASHDGSRYAYQPNHRPTPTMTAEALLCRMYLGWNQDYAPLHQGVRHLLREHMPHDRSVNYYYWYYATQVMHHMGGRSWKNWNLAMRDILVDSQETKGHEAGSWKPRGPHAGQAGRLYTTALAVCTLEVYYRHAPIFRQLDLE